ncbi:MAG: hypothetical protein JSS74_02805 [Actinobacteria bacterium]|nr:hypothetical protein [Actinomycetota bacterium]
MPTRRDIPAGLGDVFHVSAARDAGVNAGRLRSPDLSSPFHGVRRRSTPATASDPGADPYEIQSAQRRARTDEYVPRLTPGQFFTHDSAAVRWGAPLPLAMTDGRIADGRALPVHVGVFGDAPLPRVRGVRGHRALARTTHIVDLDGVSVMSAASTWASMGASLPLMDLVALGDYFCRRWREGVGRKDPGRPPLATIEELRAAVGAGRRVGVANLREGLELIREDSWSPRESLVRCILVTRGLPEPELNIDVFEAGKFLGCVDLAYPHLRIAIEYHGILHSDHYAADVERMAALRHAGWIVIEVTAELVKEQAELVRRVRRALAQRS